MKSKIIVTIGLPGSGKSFWAKKQLEENPGVYKRVNKDSLRELIDNSKWSKDNEKMVLEVRDFIIKQALSSGKSVIVDDCNFSQEHIKTFKKIAEELNADFEIKVFDTPLYECIDRDSRRLNPIGKKHIIDMYNKNIKKTPEKFIRNDKKLCIIVDVDGTLAYKSERDIYDYSKVINDIPNLQLSMIINSVRKELDVEIIIVSGREDNCAVETGSWIYEKCFLNYDALYMRKSGDHREDTIVKKEIYEEYIKDKYQVLAVFDDRPSVIRMWKDLGLFVLDCNREDSRIDF